MILLSGLGCAGGENTGPGPDRHTPEPCGDLQNTSPRGQAGQMEIDQFDPFADGEAVTLQYGSQAGMGLGVVLALEDLDLELVNRIDVSLIVDEQPLGQVIDRAFELECSSGVSYFEAMVMLDVLSHPTVASAAQLDGREALVEFQVFSDADLLLEGSTAVVLQL